MSYVGEARFRFDGPADLCSRYIPIARVLVERTKAMHDVGGSVSEATRTIALADGTTIKVIVFSNAPPIITIAPSDVRRRQAVDLTLDTFFTFYSTNTELEALGPYYVPGSVADAYGDLADATGVWEVRDLVAPVTPLLASPRKVHYSLDLQPNGYPRYVTSWSGQEITGVANDSYVAFVPDSTYLVNGAEVTAPGPVIGAIREKQLDAVFVANTTTGVAVERYDRDETGEWALTWSSAVAITDEAAGIADTMVISQDGLNALFSVAAKFDDDTYNENDFIVYAVLLSIDLTTGDQTHVYGSKAVLPQETQSRRATTTNTEFPNDTVYMWHLSETIEAGAVSSLHLTGLNEDVSLPRTVPRVGDEFHFSGTGGGSVNFEQSSHIRVTSVTYTPWPQTLSGGEVFTSSIQPHQAGSVDVGIEWIKIGVISNDDGSEDPVHPSRNQRIVYINDTGAVGADHVFEQVNDTSGEFLVAFGYDRQGTITYAVQVVDSVYSQVRTVTSDSVEASITETDDEEEIDNSYVEIRGGELNLARVDTGSASWRFDQVQGVSDLVFEVDSLHHSGWNYVQNAAGTIQVYLMEDVWHPTDTPIGTFSETAVYGTSTDDLTISTDIAFALGESAYVVDDYGFVYYLELSKPSSAIQNVTEEEFTTRRYNNYIGGLVTETEKMPYKDSYGQTVWHGGTQKASWRMVRTEDMGDGGSDAGTNYAVGNNDYHTAAHTYDAFPHRIRYTTGWTSSAVGSLVGRLAVDPMHNVVAGFDRSGHDDPGNTLRADGYGYVYRANGVDELDPRSIFQGTPSASGVTDVHWGAVTTRITREVRDATNEDDAGQTIYRTNEPTFRLP